MALRCAQYDEAREKLYRELSQLEIPYPYEIDVWVRKPDLAPLKALYRFLVDISKKI